MGKPQLTQLPNYQNYQYAIKVKTPTLSWIPQLSQQPNRKSKMKTNITNIRSINRITNNSTNQSSQR